MVFSGPWSEVTGQILIVGFFLVSGVSNLQRSRRKGHIERSGGFGTPYPTFVFWAGMVVQFLGCALIIGRWHADLGVMLLILFTIVATAIYYRFWQVHDDPMKRNTMRLGLLSNIALLGGLLLFLHSVESS
jgi:uncharacterized membrane protein YphA (DoxX/SURF4 family)